jgi:hypothetical protein
MGGKVNVAIRGKSDLTKKRHQIDILIKKAMKGGKNAKIKLFKEYCIKLYSSEEIGSYVEERLKTEVVNDSPSRNGVRGVTKTIPKRKGKRVYRRR